MQQQTSACVERQPPVEPGRKPSHLGPTLARFCRAMVDRLFDPRVRQLPLGHPDTLADKPGERRIVFGHKVLVIRDKD